MRTERLLRSNRRWTRIHANIANIVWSIIGVYRRPSAVRNMSALSSATLERKQPPNILLGEWRAVLAALERLGVLHRAAGLLAVAGDQQVAIAIGIAAQARIHILAQPRAPRLRIRGHLVEIAAVVGQPLVHLRDMAI